MRTAARVEETAMASGSVTLINPFEVPAGREDEALAMWDGLAAYMRGRPGFLATRLHKAVAPGARFALANVAEWASAEAFLGAAAAEEFRELTRGSQERFPHYYYSRGSREPVRRCQWQRRGRCWWRRRHRDQSSTAPGSGRRTPTRRQSSRRTSGTVSGSSSAARSSGADPPDGRRADHGEVGVGQHGQGHVAVPARPGADLVLVQPHLALRGLEAGLDRPARPRHPHQRGEVRRLGRQRQVEGQLVRLVRLAPDQQPLRPAGRGAAAAGQVRPVVEPRPLAAPPGAQPAPALRRAPARPRVPPPAARPPGRRPLVTASTWPSPPRASIRRRR